MNISATAKAGYAFDKWNDCNTSASRTVNVSKNESFVAQFKEATQGGGTGDEDDPAFL